MHVCLGHTCTGATLRSVLLGFISDLALLSTRNSCVTEKKTPTHLFNLECRDGIFLHSSSAWCITTQWRKEISYIDKENKIETAPPLAFAGTEKNKQSEVITELSLLSSDPLVFEFPLFFIFPIFFLPFLYPLILRLGSAAEARGGRKNPTPRRPLPQFQWQMSACSRTLLD